MLGYFFSKFATTALSRSVSAGDDAQPESVTVPDGPLAFFAWPSAVAAKTHMPSATMRTPARNIVVRFIDPSEVESGFNVAKRRSTLRWKRREIKAGRRSRRNFLLFDREGPIALPSV